MPQSVGLRGKLDKLGVDIGLLAACRNRPWASSCPYTLCRTQRERDLCLASSVAKCARMGVSQRPLAIGLRATG